jgi:beta-lactamase regulating signal transducer with metallopeptidase domain
MTNPLASLWQFNIEISLLLLLVMVARYAVRKTTKVYNAYLLWLSIPVGVITAQLVAQLRFTKPPVETVNYLVHSYIVQPAHEYSSWGILAYVWSGLTAMLLLRLMLQHIQLRHDLKSIEVPTELVSRSSYPIVGIDKNDFSPAVYGFFRPTIYFPIQLENSLSSEQISLIIQHEEHHIRQQHLWLNLLWDILVCFMWFNPLVYIARQNFRHDQELFCDYLVLNKSSQHASRSYGHALLTTVTATHSVSLLCSWKSFNQLEERIMNIKRPTSLSSKIAISFAAMLVISGASIYSVSAAQYASQHFSHEVDDDGNSEIVWTTKGKTFVENNGQQYVLNGANKREPNAQERAAFESKIEQSSRDWVRAEVIAEQKELALGSSEHEFQVLEEQRLKRESQRRRAAESRELAMIERQEHKRQQDIARREADQLRREIELQRKQTARRLGAEQRQRDTEQRRRDTEQRRRDAMQAERDAGQEKRDAMQKQRAALGEQRRAVDEQRRLMQKQQRELKKTEREENKVRRQLERAVEAERHKLASSEQERLHRQELLADYQIQIARAAQKMEQQRESLASQAEAMELKKRALEHAKDDLEDSFQAGKITQAQMREVRREFKNVKRIVERSPIEVAKVAELSNRERNQLQEHTYPSINTMPSSAPAAISRLEASMQPNAPMARESTVVPTLPMAPLAPTIPVEAAASSSEQNPATENRVYDMRLAQ